MKSEERKRKSIKKNVFVKKYEEFKHDVLSAFGSEVEVFCDCDGIYFECKWNGDALCTEEVLAGMSKYYDVEVTSIHMDDCELLGVWICYK